VLYCSSGKFAGGVTALCRISTTQVRAFIAGKSRMRKWQCALLAAAILPA